MKVRCEKWQECGNTDCMHWEKHDRITHDNRKELDCYNDFTICPLQPKLVQCKPAVRVVKEVQLEGKH